MIQVVLSVPKTEQSREVSLDWSREEMAVFGNASIRCKWVTVEDNGILIDRFKKSTTRF